MTSKTVLICAPRMPEFDREGGSRRIFHLIELFQQAGWKVYFAADEAVGGKRYAWMLQQRGVPVYVFRVPWDGGEDALIDIEQLLKLEHFDVALFAFWICGERYISLVRAASPDTVVITDSIDLHFLRESRRVFNASDPKDSRNLDVNYGSDTSRELNTYGASDAVLTVSQKEAALVNDFLGRTAAFAIPDMEEISPSDLALEDRRGILFVGNFRHPPNVQAAEFLCEQILPLIPTGLLSKHPLYIIGTEPTESVIKAAGAAPGTRLVGWVPSLQPYLHHVRVSVVPLLYGAGTKRKLMQSLMAGVPAVSTPIGVEGFEVVHGEHVLVGSTARDLAGYLQNLLQDDDLWHRIASKGRELMQSAHGRDEVFGKFSEAISTILGKRATGEKKSDVSDTSPQCPQVWFEEMGRFESGPLDLERDWKTRQAVKAAGKFEGICNISGVQTDFSVSSDNFREDLRATSSSSINRQRQIVCALSIALFNQPHVFLRAIAAHANQHRIRFYITETGSSLSNHLKDFLDPELLVSSEYFGPKHRSGELVNGIRHEDLQKTSFADASFDVVISSDVFEHIPDAPAAEKEVMRILKPGGVHCFTVPFGPAMEEDLVAAELDAHGNVKHYRQPEYHLDPIRKEGILVYRIFSHVGMKQRFEAEGHRFKSYRLWSKSLGILGDNCWVHIAQKNSSMAQRVSSGT